MFKGTGGGLALFWKNEDAVQIIDSSNNYIDFEVSNDQVGRWRYTGVYGYPERRRRVEAWNMISMLAQKSSLPWCMIGDYNDLMFDSEKKGGRKHPRALLQGFSDTVANCGLIDLGYEGERFTWERCRGTDLWIQERLDRGLATRAWLDLFPNAVVKVVDVSISGHLPLFLDLSRKVYVPKSKRFRFENVWIREKDCFNVIANCWEDMATCTLLDKLANCCLKLEEWGGGLIKEIKDNLKLYRNQMKKYRSRRDVQGLQLYSEARWNFLRLIEKQEIFWQQRAKQLWLAEGDENSRYFHNYASKRKSRNHITGLMDSNGIWQESNDAVRNIITDYFSQLFQTSQAAEGLTNGEYVASVSTVMNQTLMLPVSEKEVKDAVFSMHPSKSPGPDGLNPAFYQTYWSIVGTDVFNFCKDFMLTGELPPGVNNTLVCLIPKIKQPQYMTQLRPISLCNVLMRILSKVLTNRLKPCLHSIISDKQSAFVEGRLLTDNAIIAYEVNHYIRRKTQGKYGVAGLKIDVSKAFDRLEWGFIENMLVKFGFQPLWINRIMACVTTVSYSFLHNGEVFGSIIPQRGIRQGDPISPYLYILCAEGLTSIINRNESVGLIHGATIARGAPSITHLLFADDCYLFFRATEVEACTMKSILHRYENLSGQAINYSKSNITFSPNTSQFDRGKVCSTLGVQELNAPGKYLGMPMFVGRNKNDTFGFLIDRVVQRLQGWKIFLCQKVGNSLF